MIEVIDLSMVYPGGRGIHNISFSVQKGEIFGFLGPNGAGKTTTIRNLLGFMQPQQGVCSIQGLSCWDKAKDIQNYLGFIPGEIAFLSGMKGNEFLKLITDMRKGESKHRQKQLEERFEINTKYPIRKMSKGMKQKIGIIAAFMHDPNIYILDEPTSGLDPLMQKRFVDLVLEEKRRGKTIFMSSHMVEEVERTCDSVGIIRDGRLVAMEDVYSLKAKRQVKYRINLHSKEDIEMLRTAGLTFTKLDKNLIEVGVSGTADALIKQLSNVSVDHIEAATASLEEIFMEYYGQEG